MDVKSVSPVDHQPVHNNIRCICYDISVKEIAFNLINQIPVKYGDKCKLCLTYVEKEVRSLNMKCYIVTTSYRKCEEPEVTGPYSTFEKAHAKFMEIIGKDTDPEYDEFGSDIAKGFYYSCDETVEIEEREIE